MSRPSWPTRPSLHADHGDGPEPPSAAAAVLCIDGEFRTTAAAVDELIRHGLRVDTAACASTGIALAGQMPYVLILLGGDLADGSATDVLKALRTVGIDTPVVVISPALDVDTAVAMMRLGAADVAIKPIGALELLSLIRERGGVDTRSREASQVQPADPREVVSQITRAVLSCPRTSLKRAARSLGMDRHAIERHVRMETGRSYREWRREIVMHGAAEVLRSSRLPIKAVAYELGYRSVGAFARAFRAVLGVTPSTYRQRLGSAPACHK